MIFKSLKSMFIVSYLIVCFVTIGVIFFFMLKFLFIHYQVQLNRTNGIILDRIAKEISDDIKEPQKIINDSYLCLSNGIVNENNMQKFLELKIKSFSNIERIEVLDLSGKVIGVAPDAGDYIGIVRKNDPVFSEASKSDKFYYSPVYISSSTGSPTFSISRKTGDYIFVIDFSLNYIHDHLLRKKTSEDEIMVIVDENGKIIFHTDINRVYEQEYEYGAGEIKESPEGIQVYLSGKKMIARKRVISETGWSAIVYHSYNSQYGQLYNMIIMTASIAGTFVFLLIFFSFYIAKRFFKPFKEVINKCGMIASGNYYNPIVYSGYSELESLIYQFNYMSKMLNEREKDLVNSRKKFYQMIQFLPDPVFAIDKNGYVTVWNKAMEEISGIKEENIVGKGDFEYSLCLVGVKRPMLIDLVFVDYDDIKKNYSSISKSGDALIGEGWVTLLDGVKRYVWGKASPLYDENGDVFGAIEILRDVTDSVHTREALIQTEKMITVGGLAAGVAHEINNPLGIILQTNENIRRRLFDDISANLDAAQQFSINLEAVREYLRSRSINNYIADIKTAGERASRIVKSMLQFSRKSELKFEDNKIIQIIENSIEFASSDYDLKKDYDFKKIKIVKEYFCDSVLYCSVIELEQVFLNILKNSAQAMMLSAIENPCIIIRVFERDKFVVVEFIDNGPGMDRETSKRVFEPFFTTKEVGTGTGLGLAVSYFIIVNNHKGSIEIDSEKGKGARFIISIPFQRNR